jgi:hypothetical protein
VYTEPADQAALLRLLIADLDIKNPAKACSKGDFTAKNVGFRIDRAVAGARYNTLIGQKKGNLVPKAPFSKLDTTTVYKAAKPGWDYMNVDRVPPFPDYPQGETAAPTKKSANNDLLANTNALHRILEFAEQIRVQNEPPGGFDYSNTKGPWRGSDN